MNSLRLFKKPFQARFISRPNRFLIRCQFKTKRISAFLPNPGRLQELLFPGSIVYLIEEGAKQRKTRYTAVAVKRDGYPIMLHTHRTNEVARYLIEQGKVPGLEQAKIVKPEVRVGRSRFDFLLEEQGKEMFLEVKSCTLVGKRVAMFPDAVTERGRRHFEELAKLSEEGFKTAILFVVHWPFAEIFMPDYHTDLNFSQTFLRVRGKVRVIPVSVGWDRSLTLSPEVKLLEIPWDHIEEEAKDRGSYLVILRLKKRSPIEIGRLGRLFFRNGFYIYVGSAMANLSKRMNRHRQTRKKHHWHIDELRAVAEFHFALAIRSSDRLECEIATAFSKIADWAVPSFGSSDCSCESHLFGMSTDPLHLEEFQKLLQYFRMDRCPKIFFAEGVVHSNSSGN